MAQVLEQFIAGVSAGDLDTTRAIVERPPYDTEA